MLKRDAARVLARRIDHLAEGQVKANHLPSEGDAGKRKDAEVGKPSTIGGTVE
jgi:hypothetical protein